MREFTHLERKTAARAIFETMTQKTPGHETRTAQAAQLRDSTIDMIAQSWAMGEETFCISNQCAMGLFLELIAAREERRALAHRAVNLQVELGEAILLQPRSEILVFTPSEIEAALDKNLAAGLRQLADAVDAGTIAGKCIDCRGHGFTPNHDPRAHLLLRIDLAAHVRQTRLEGENNVSGSDQGK